MAFIAQDTTRRATCLHTRAALMTTCVSTYRRNDRPKRYNH